MPDQRSDLCTRGEELMQEQRFADAIEAFDGHLVREPTDPKALLQLGICHLLDRSEQTFLDIYRRAGRLLGTMERIPAEVSRLWTLYRSLVAKVTATALVTSTVGLTACNKTDPIPDPVLAPPTTSVVETADPIDEATVATGDTAPSASASATPVTTATSASPPPPATTITRPAHRYSGGVRPNPTPAHRYSAGVRRSPSPERTN
ncbi:MAG: hypothetical protein DRI90_04570 [Deltaproteobacteria bacterium]|nr:MAG: hypothetical protein DRI90_04570 [Deltaproteobacteria bacterium]